MVEYTSLTRTSTLDSRVFELNAWSLRFLRGEKTSGKYSGIPERFLNRLTLAQFSQRQANKRSLRRRDGTVSFKDRDTIQHVKSARKPTASDRVCYCSPWKNETQ